MSPSAAAASYVSVLHVGVSLLVISGTSVVLCENFPAFDVLIFGLDGTVNLLEVSKSAFSTPSHCAKKDMLASAHGNSGVSLLDDITNRCGLATTAPAEESPNILPPAVRYIYLTTQRSTSYLPRGPAPRFYDSVLHVNRLGFVGAFASGMPASMRKLLRSVEDF